MSKNSTRSPNRQDPETSWVAVKELKLVYHNGYIVHGENCTPIETAMSKNSTRSPNRQDSETNWVAIKELKLVYHNGYMERYIYIYTYMYMSILKIIGFPPYGNLNEKFLNSGPDY